MKTILLATIVAVASVMAAPKALAEVETYVSKTYDTIHARGLVRTPESKEFLRTAPRVSFVNKATAVPGKYSLVDKAGPVEDQGQCGSCWDFALTETLRGTWMTAGKDPGRLSFNYLLNCATAYQGCNGGDFGAADLFISPKGAPDYGSDGDYTEQSGTCESRPAVASTLSYKLLGTDGGANPGGVTPSFKDIAYVVGVLHKPVSIDVAADANWENYSTGVYNGCSDENVADINHMVVLEGYDCEKAVDANKNCKFDAKGNLPAGVGKWIIKNSWGTGWGEGGYIYTKATDANGAACNAVATDALYYDIK